MSLEDKIESSRCTAKDKVDLSYGAKKNHIGVKRGQLRSFF